VAVRPDSPGDFMPDRGTYLDQITIDVDRPGQAELATVRVHTVIDAVTAPDLQHRLETLLSEGVQRLVLDLSAVPFCDVPALNMLLRIQSRLRSRGGQLAVRGACPPLRIMVLALGLEGQLPLTPQPGADHADQDGARPA
jgi:anti-sigma B factor antagonist